MACSSLILIYVPYLNNHNTQIQTYVTDMLVDHQSLIYLIVFLY